MRARGILAFVLAVTPYAHAGCDKAGWVRDRGLHRAWRVEQNCRHPERPAVLVEVAWAETEPMPIADGGETGTETRSAPVAVQAGTRVTVTRYGGNAVVQLAATALGTAHLGQRVDVRTTLSGTVLHGIARGPGLVELAPERGGD